MRGPPIERCNCEDVYVQWRGGKIILHRKLSTVICRESGEDNHFPVSLLSLSRPSLTIIQKKKKVRKQIMEIHKRDKNKKIKKLR